MIYALADITWRPAIGDPNPLAWLIVIVHLSASLLCVAAGRRQIARSDATFESRLWYFWFVLAGLMFALSLNKQLDLQTLLTQAGRSIAKHHGWYQQRRTLQEIFVFGCIGFGLTGAVASFYVVRGRWNECGLAYLGFVFLATFVCIRAASFHHVDTFLYHLPFVGNRMNAALELGGSLMVAAGAFSANRKRTS